jgi:hypothetical protein
MSIGVGDAVTMIRDDEFAPISLRSKQQKRRLPKEAAFFDLIS